VFLVLIGLVCSSFAQSSPYVKITGKLAGPNGLPAANDIISLTPSQSFFVAGSGTLPPCSYGAADYLFQINGVSLTPCDTLNFNGSTPATPTNGINVTFATSRSGTTDSVSGAIIGDGDVNHFLNGIGTYTTPGSSATCGGTAFYCVDLTGIAANIGSTPIFVSAGTAKLIRVTFYFSQTQAATSSSSFFITLFYQDNGSTSSSQQSAVLNSNCVPNGSMCQGQINAINDFWINMPASGTFYFTGTYASSGATAAQYQLHMRAEVM
jgi:hypothetical protein